MPTQSVEFPREGNPLWPLPPDYEALSRDGQRLARINACSLHRTPELWVAAWNFFRRTYLMTTEPGFFYGDDLVESPPFHYSMISDIGQYGNNLHGAPRGFAKSTLADEVILLLALTRPRFPTSLCLASENLLSERFEIYMRQFRENQFILDDFGSQEPARGKGSWNQHVLSLTNGSRIKGFPVMGRKRGTKPRPKLLVLDDPEYDPSGSTDMQKLRNQFDWLLFRVLLPMGQKGMNMWWIGTIISKQSALYYASHSDDARFARFWNRSVLAVEEPDENGEYRPIWDAYMSKEEIETTEAKMGSAAFGAEYRNAPGEGTDATFPLDPTRHGYWVIGDLGDDPLTSMATIRYHQKDASSEKYVERLEEAGLLISKMQRIMLMDYASTVGPHSDYSALAVLGFLPPTDILWVLDVWAGRVRQPALLHQIYRLGRKWRVRVVGVEAVAMQEAIADSVTEYLGTLGEATGWSPRVLPIRYPYGLRKTDRIGGMSWRFASARIKLPYHLEATPIGRMMFQNFRDFRAEAPDGNLQHDDLIDAICMYQQIRRSRSSGAFDSEPREASCPAEALAAGDLYYKGTDILTLSGMNASEITPKALSLLMDQMASEANGSERKRNSRDLSMHRSVRRPSWK